MVFAKQMQIRSNIKEYFDMAYDGETIIVPRKNNKNVVIISEEEYHTLSGLRHLEAYAEKYQTISKSSAKSKNISESSLKDSNIKKLGYIEQLPNGWNGNGAPTIPTDVIRKTLQLIESLPIQPEIFPTALESIQLEYDNSRHDHMEIDINSGNVAEIFIVSYTGEKTEESIISDSDTISERVLQFYG